VANLVSLDKGVKRDKLVLKEPRVNLEHLVSMGRQGPQETKEKWVHRGRWVQLVV